MRHRCYKSRHSNFCRQIRFRPRPAEYRSETVGNEQRAGPRGLAHRRRSVRVGVVWADVGRSRLRRKQPRNDPGGPDAPLHGYFEVAQSRHQTLFGQRSLQFPLRTRLFTQLYRQSSLQRSVLSLNSIIGDAYMDKHFFTPVFPLVCFRACLMLTDRAAFLIIIFNKTKTNPFPA